MGGIQGFPVSASRRAVKTLMRRLRFCIMMELWTTCRQTGRKPSSGRAVYGRLSETCDAAESVPTQLERGTAHAERRGWTVVATFKDDGYSAFKEITRDEFAELIAAIAACRSAGQGDPRSSDQGNRRMKKAQQEGFHCEESLRYPIGEQKIMLPSTERDQ